MDSKDYIRQMGFDQLKDNNDMKYMDEDIAFHTDIREFPIGNGSIRVNMLVLVLCHQRQTASRTECIGIYHSAK